LRGEPAAARDFEEVANDFTEQFGKDATKALLKILDPIASKLKVQEETLEARKQAETNRMLDDQRARLGEKYPRLKESDHAWKMVVLDASQRANEWEGEVEALFDDSVSLIYGDPAPKSTTPRPRSSPDESRQRNNGQPSPGYRRTPTETLSKEERGTRLLVDLEEKHGVFD
jgi:hypothetical protein